MLLNSLSKKSLQFQLLDIRMKPYYLKIISLNFTENHASEDYDKSVTRAAAAVACEKHCYYRQLRGMVPRARV